jgi:chromosome segregation ATPase
MDQTRTRQRVHAPNQQLDQFRACTQSQNRVRTQARDMAGLAGRPGSSSKDALRQRDQLREHVRFMQQEHQRLLQGLGPEQQEAARRQIREMERIQERLQTRMQELDAAVDSPSFDFSQVATRAREVERTMQQWQKQHRKLGNQIGARS